MGMARPSGRRGRRSRSAPPTRTARRGAPPASGQGVGAHLVGDRSRRPRCGRRPAPRRRPPRRRAAPAAAWSGSSVTGMSSGDALPGRQPGALQDRPRLAGEDARRGGPRRGGCGRCPAPCRCRRWPGRRCCSGSAGSPPGPRRAPRRGAPMRRQAAASSAWSARAVALGLRRRALAGAAASTAVMTRRDRPRQVDGGGARRGETRGAAAQGGQIAVRRACWARA